MVVGVAFTPDAQGKASSLSAGRHCFAKAAAACDPAVGDAVLGERNWYAQYGRHVYHVTELAARDRDAAVAIARAGLDAAMESSDALAYHVPGAPPVSMAAAARAQPLASGFRTGMVQGDGVVSTELRMPCDGADCVGTEFLARVDAWYRHGVMEPGAAAALRETVENAREWLDLRGRVFVVLGSSSALGPLRHLLTWGATVVAIGTRRPERWAALADFCATTPGTLVFPTAADADGAGLDRAGVDLLTEAPAIARWVQEACISTAPAGGFISTTIGVYTYLDGEAHVRVTAACDVVVTGLVEQMTAAGEQARLMVAYLGTPSIPYLVPDDCRRDAEARYLGSWYRTLGFEANAMKPTRSGLFLHNGLVAVQGPNYAFAKTLQVWRAVVLMSQGVRVSCNVAPPAKSASVVAGNNRNAKQVATGMNGMGRLPPMLAFAPATASALMAGLLIHDLHSAVASQAQHPHTQLALKAIHGGSFRHAIRANAAGALMYMAGLVCPKHDMGV